MGNARADDLSVTYVCIAAGVALRPALGRRDVAGEAGKRYGRTGNDA